jgi:hypothetical protein
MSLISLTPKEVGRLCGKVLWQSYSQILPGWTFISLLWKTLAQIGH